MPSTWQPGLPGKRPSEIYLLFRLELKYLDVSMAYPPVQAEAPLRRIDRDLAKVLQGRVISGLDALRALAVTLVLVDHYRVTDHLFHTHPELGALGVMIFFVLSGFLITSILLREYDATGSISFSNFYLRRAFRIFPAFYCCWMVATAVDLAFHEFFWKGAMTSFFYMMDYGRAFHAGELAYSHMLVSWSLAVEEKFYLLWPLLLVFLLKRQSTMLRTICLIIFGLWMYRALLYLVFGVRWGYLYCAFEMRADALLVGCLLAILVRHDDTRLACCRVLRWQWLSVLPPLVLAWAVVMPPANRAFFLLLWSLQPLIIAAMLLQAAYWGARSWRFCRSRMVRVVALLSYSLYLYHPIGSKIIYLLHIPHNGLASAVLVPPMAVASYFLVERPFMRMRDRYSPHRATMQELIPAEAGRGSA
jgi:peptidoglycan/LPS O-acetylase OafA/YrhL